MLFDPPIASPYLALVTTVHLGLAALRNHRTPPKWPLPLGAVSLLMAALPWMFPGSWGIVLGLGIHGAWFEACEYLAPSAPAAVPSRNAPLPRAESPARRAAAEHTQRPRGFVQVPVLATFDETPTVRTIRVARPEGFHFESGQFMPVRVRVDGKELTRCYSISSAPSAGGYLEISVKRQGVVSNALHAALRPGSQLAIRQPAGAFKYPAADDRPLVLIAGGVGITPLMSMLRHGVGTQPTRPITILYGVHSEVDFAFRDELESLARRHPQVRLQLAATTASVDGTIYPGRIDASLLAAVVPDLVHSIVMICGPAPMIASLEAILAAAGVPAPQVRHEAFEAAIAAAADAPVRAVAPARQGTFRVSCTRSDRQMGIQAGQTLLEAAEEAGVQIPSLCRSGVCGTCRVQVTGGQVDCESATLSAEEVGQGIVLACVATASSDCAVSV